GRAGGWASGGRGGWGGGWRRPPPPLRSPPRPGRGRRSSPAPCPISPPGSAPCRRKGRCWCSSAVCSATSARPPASRLLLERFLALAANCRQRHQHAQRQGGDEQAEADRPVEENHL